MLVITVNREGSDADPNQRRRNGGTMMKETLSARFRTTPAGSHLRVMLVAVMLVLALPILGWGPMRARAQSGTATATAESCPPATPTTGTPTPNLCVEIGQYDIYFKPNL